VRLQFTKMHGAGNDFVVVDHREPFLPDAAGVRSALFAKWCDRRRGIGADGVLLLERESGLDFRMRYHNSDGGIAEFCGNGARCIARFALSLGLGRDGRVRFATDAGVKAAALRDDGRIALEFGAVDAGEAVELEACGRTFRGRRVLTGVPHLVLPVAGLGAIPFSEWAPPLRSHPALGPGGANVDFVEPLPGGRVAMRTWERGVEGETLACGSGAMASALWAVTDGGASAPVTVRTAGGDDLVVELGTRDGRMEAVLVGPAVHVFTGEWQEA
jgi:diaminopimelate epimerase